MRGLRDQELQDRYPATARHHRRQSNEWGRENEYPETSREHRNVQGFKQRGRDIMEAVGRYRETQTRLEQSLKQMKRIVGVQRDSGTSKYIEPIPTSMNKDCIREGKQPIFSSFIPCKEELPKRVNYNKEAETQRDNHSSLSPDYIETPQKAKMDSEQDSFVVLNSYYESRLGSPIDFTGQDQSMDYNISADIFTQEELKRMGEGLKVSSSNPFVKLKDDASTAGFDIVEVEDTGNFIYDSDMTSDHVAREQAIDERNSCSTEELLEKDQNHNYNQRNLDAKNSNLEIKYLTSFLKKIQEEFDEYRRKAEGEILHLREELVELGGKYNDLVHKNDELSKSYSRPVSARRTERDREPMTSSRRRVDSDLSEVSKTLRREIDLTIGALIRLIETRIVDRSVQQELRVEAYKIAIPTDEVERVRRLKGLLNQLATASQNINTDRNQQANQGRRTSRVEASFSMGLHSTASSDAHRDKTIKSLQAKNTELEDKVRKVCESYTRSVTKFQNKADEQSWKSRLLQFSNDSLYLLLSQLCKKLGAELPLLVSKCREYFGRLQEAMGTRLEQEEETKLFENLRWNVKVICSEIIRAAGS